MSDARHFDDPTADGVTPTNVTGIQLVLPNSNDDPTAWDFCITEMYAIMSPVIIVEI